MIFFIVREFPDKVASMFAMIELFFGIGESSWWVVKPFQGRLWDLLSEELSMRLEASPSPLR